MGDVVIISISALLISFLSCYLPALKASKQDPVSIIRFYRN